MFKDDFITIARAHHLSLSTERSYWSAARCYIKWLGAKSAKDLERDPTGNFRRYLSAMANENHDREEGNEGVSTSSQNLAFHAIRFLYEKVVGITLGDLSQIPRATGHQRIVDVPDDESAAKIVAVITGINGTAIRTIYGTAGRINDILRLRVKDLDFKRRLIAIQESKGGKSRLVPMPASLISELSSVVTRREATHKSDLAAGFGWVQLPGNLAMKYPGEDKSLGWQYVFASDKISTDPRTKNSGRHHLQPITLQRAFQIAKRKVRIKRRYTIHSLRHSCAQFWEANGVERSKIQTLLGHSYSSTTDRYLLSGIKNVASVPTPI